jgi:hypothetical protein
MKEHNLKTDKTERKLTQLLDTRGEFFVFYSVYLYFLIDTCGFEIEDVERLQVFTAHESFHEFATQTMKRRQEAILAGDKVRDLFNKISLNGSYGFDLMDESNYRKVKIMNKHKTNLAILTPNYRSATKIRHDAYLVESVPKTFQCKTCVHIGVATLDIAKMLYLNFIYNFMYKCLDMDRVHYIEGDTDSGYWAVSAPQGQLGFEGVIKDEKFYLENIDKYLTSDFYGVKRDFNTKLEKMQFDKKLGGLAIEKQSKNMIALASKLYTIWDDTKETGKAKGVSEHFKHTQYQEVLEKRKIIDGTNRTLRMNEGEMSHIATNKRALTAIYLKYKVSNDGLFCSPLFLPITDAA